MRDLAGCVSRYDPGVLAISQIDSGDALALATRFARQWAYRGGQALFWKTDFRAERVLGDYLPFVSSRPFDRRGFLQVDGRLKDRPCSLYVTFFGRARSQYVPEMRFVRTKLRPGSTAIAFAHGVPSPGLADLGFCDTSTDGKHHDRIYARGLARHGEERNEGVYPALGMPAFAELIIT